MGTDWERWKKIGKVKKRWGGIGREGRDRERWGGTARGGKVRERCGGIGIGAEGQGAVGRDSKRWEEIGSG